MNTEMTEIAVVVDRSGSMHSIWPDTIGGLRQFVSDQKQLDGQANLTLNVFDHEFLTVLDRVPLRDVDMGQISFGPRGNTALYDSIGRTVTTLAEQMEAMEEPARPAKVLLAIFTDGAENASTEYTRTKVMELIQKQESRSGWTFLYLAAGQEAMVEGERLGISASRRVVYEATGENTSVAYGSLGAIVSNARSSDIHAYQAMRFSLDVTAVFEEMRAPGPGESQP